MVEDNNKKQLFLHIKNAQNGNQNSFEILKEQYNPLIKGCTSRHTVVGMTSQDVEDLHQEALVNFCRAVCSYDCDFEGVEFGLYAKICIENGLVSFVRSFARVDKNHTIPLDENVYVHNASERRDPLQAMVDKENASELVRVIRNCLSKYENRVWWMYVSGMSVAQIADAVGTDAKSVSNAVYRIRKKLRDRVSRGK